MDAVPHLRHRSFGAAALLVVLVTASCAPFRVKVDYDAEADFRALRTYAWLERSEQPGANPFADNPLLRKRVRDAVADSLTERGYRAAPADEADFRMTFHVTLEERMAASSWPGWSYGHYGRYGGYRAGSYSSAYTFQQGTLILDALTGDAEQLLWRGWVSGAVPTSDSDRDRVVLAVHEILAHFPMSQLPMAQPAHD